MKTITIYVDGATGGGGKRTGAAAVARSPNGHFVGWLSEQMTQMTNNEAEYQAVLLGLRLAELLEMKQVVLISDSETVVRQMQGRSRVLSPRLKRLHVQTCQAVGHFDGVQFRHVLRDKNRLADALAGEAMVGQTVTMPTRKMRGRSFSRSVSHYFSSRLSPTVETDG